MFAFAIYDACSQKVVLCRDCLGIKPLYFATTERGAVVFVSEIQALLSWVGAGVSTPDSVFCLQRGSCPHGRLLFEKVVEFPSGCWAALRPGKPVRL